MRKALVSGLVLAALLGGALVAGGCSGSSSPPAASDSPGGGAAGPVWVEFGPKPQFNAVSRERIAGRTAALLALDANTLLMGSAGGGVWRSTDGGQTWTPTTDAMPNSNIGALARDPGNPQVVYCGTGEANSPGKAATDDLDPVRGILLRTRMKGGPAAVRSGVGIYRSENGGQTWTLMPGSTVFERMCIAKILVDPNDTDRIFVATVSSELATQGAFGLYLSDDGGASFDNLAGIGGFPSGPTEVTDVVFQPGNSQVLLAAVYGRGIFRSTNGGADWQPATLDTGGQALGRVEFGPSPADPDVVYALVGSQGQSFLGLYASDDGGQGFVPLGTAQDLANAIGSQAFYNVGCVADGSDPTVCYVGGVELARADNIDIGARTVTYTGLSNGDEPGSPHADHHVLILGPGGELLTGNDGGVWRLPSPASQPAFPGTSWENLNGGDDGRAVATIQFTGFSLHPINPLIAWGGSQDNNSVRMGGTLSWLERVPLSTGGFVLADGGKSVIDPRNGDLVWVQQQNGIFYRSTNGGDLFTRAVDGLDLDQPSEFYPPVAVVVQNQQTTLATGRRGVWETDSETVGWTQAGGAPLVSSGTLTALAYAPGNRGVLYAGSDDGRIFVRTQAGGAFVPGGTGLPAAQVSGLAVDRFDNRRAYCTIQAFGGGKVFRTVNGGLTWTDVTGNLPDLPHNDVVVDSLDSQHRVLYVGNDRGVYVSTNDGLSWQVHGTGLATVAVVDLEIGSQPPRLAAGTHGRGLWECPLLGSTLTLSGPPPGPAPTPRVDLARPGRSRSERVRQGP